MGGGKGGRTRSGRRRRSEMVENFSTNEEKMSKEVTTRFLSLFAGQATQASLEECVCAL